MAISQLNSLRSRAVVPGLATAAWLGHNNVSHLPLLLIQNPGDKGDHRRGYGSGWDVVVPAGWGMPVWLGLIYRGARAGGLRDTNKIRLESSAGPTLAPDTLAGQTHSELCRREREEKFFRLPPDKRPNYIKLGVVAPFHCPWERLLQDWYLGEEDRKPYVIRRRDQLDLLRYLLNKTQPVVMDRFCDRDKLCGIVQVAVEMCGRGTLTEYAMICAPNKKDMKLTKGKSGRGPSEPLHVDENEQCRKTERTAHLAKLKRLRKKRVKDRLELEDKGIFLPKEKKIESPTQEIVQKQADLMKELWLPSDIKTVKNSASRCVMGFVTCGDFSFTRSQSVGYGFVALSALLSALEKNQQYYLVRNVTSMQYYFVRLKVLNPL